MWIWSEHDRSSCPRGGRRDGRAGRHHAARAHDVRGDAGEFWCVTGGNGSGKTTLLRAFLGTWSLTAGSCAVRGEPADMAKPAHRRLVASLVEQIPVARDMTLREQVTLS
ncbi:ATP-binding cassette domain-containing protein [Streptomyces sp. NPDC059896]|uniref:ATP-binding cassette domain-containing protein n=1 Tax=Streptomyces sp. NPDC059896 TaxID=3346993 RepID=UPI003659740A